MSRTLSANQTGAARISGGAKACGLVLCLPAGILTTKLGSVPTSTSTATFELCANEETL